ncbi:MAG: hypothetical protein JW843_09200 [Candidatus Aminicenantes bacterium]|nr:hypothetical protein [Candidatus Aminicenantes bacterium]
MIPSRPKAGAGRKGTGRMAGAWAFIRGNASAAFGGKTVAFVLLAVAVFLAVAALTLLNRRATIDAQHIYDFLLVPALILLFYPAAFALQGDKDAGMIEVLFGIPDYRFKVWLARYLTIYLTVGMWVLVLALLSRIGLAAFPLGRMVLEVMIPILFIGSLAFYLAASTGSGIATSVLLLVVIGLFWLFRDSLAAGPWYLFHNPFVRVEEIKAMVLAKTTFANRLYLLSGFLVLTLLSLLRLQKREKFI